MNTKKNGWLIIAVFAKQPLTKLVGQLNMVMQNFPNTYYPIVPVKLSAKLFLP